MSLAADGFFNSLAWRQGGLLTQYVADLSRHCLCCSLLSAQVKPQRCPLMAPVQGPRGSDLQLPFSRLSLESRLHSDFIKTEQGDWICLNRKCVRLSGLYLCCHGYKSSTVAHCRGFRPIRFLYLTCVVIIHMVPTTDWWSQRRVSSQVPLKARAMWMVSAWPCSLDWYPHSGHFSSAVQSRRSQLTRSQYRRYQGCCRAACFLTPFSCSVDWTLAPPLIYHRCPAGSDGEGLRREEKKKKGRVGGIRVCS